MHIEHHYWHSPRLGHDMGVAVFGHWGLPLLAFPTSHGDEWELQRQGLIGAIGEFIDGGTNVGDPPEHIDPAVNSTLDAYQVINAMYDGLTDVDASDPANPVIKPHVAESFESLLRSSWGFLRLPRVCPAFALASVAAGLDPHVRPNAST